MTNINAIELRNVEVTVGENIILDNLSLTVAENEMCAIIGANGSGKSTLGRAIMGLSPISKGSLLIGDNCVVGENVDKPFTTSVARRLGASMVFQNPDNQVFGNTVAEELHFGISLLPPAEQRKRIEEVLEIVPIEHLLNKTIQTLSGGQKQLVALASILVFQPKILILDEITSMLDGETKEAIISVLSSKLKGTMTIIAISHDFNMIRAMDNVAVLCDGCIVAKDSPTNIYQQGVSQWNIGEPFEVQICRGLQQGGYDIGMHLTAQDILKNICGKRVVC